MDLILGHTNADFDCLGAMVAAQCLYPGACLTFPGSQEKCVQDFIARHAEVLPHFTRAKEIDLSSVSRLILVDCQQPERIGRFAELSDRPGVDIHIYDHHPQTATSITPTGGCIRPCGSTSSILTTIIKERQTPLTTQQATVIMLGIYEDTGNLLFPGTSSDDFLAAAWLLEQGAQLRVVADFVSRGLTTQQVALLDTLLKNLSHRLVHGVTVSISYATTEEYSNDISRLADLMRDMENLDVLFLAVNMGNSIVMVARSRLPEVDAGKTMHYFKGGGHATAASASVRNQSLKQVLERLETVLPMVISPLKTAQMLMSSPVKTIPSGTPLDSARELLIRYNCTSMPVMQQQTIVGIISRKTIEKAIYHGLHDTTVDEYMQTDFMTATPDTPLAEIQVTIIEANQRFVPVVDHQQLVGAITRTDLLRYLYGGSTHQPGALYDVETLGFVTRHVSLEQLIAKHPLPQIITLLHDFGAVADQLGLAVYAVGGFVRDLILGVENFDLDITVEGDGIFFAKQYVAQRECRMNPHPLFGTAVIIFPNGNKVDVASTRLEYYQSPGVLPTVERSSLRHDLYRRDFTINTLAICLNAERFGMVTDYFGGRLDLQKRSIKVLHNLSFVEDPSRVFRAIRFEQRLGFTIAPHTEHLMRSSIRMNGLDAIAGIRMYNELVLILKEKEPVKALLRMSEIGLFPAILPQLRLPPDTARVLHETTEVVAWFRLMYLPDQCQVWQVYFLAFSSNLSSLEFQALLQRLTVPARLIEHTFGQRDRVLQLCKRLQRMVRHGTEPLANSMLYKLLHNLAIESLLYLTALAREEEVRRLVSHYLTHLRKTRCELDGNDLKALGLMPGVHFKTIMQQLLTARLDGVVTDKESELALAQKLIALHQTL